MSEGRGKEPRASGADRGRRVAGLDEAIRASRQRNPTTEGVRTFLLLEDGVSDAVGETLRATRGRADAGDRALGELAAGMLGCLAGDATDHPSSRDVALALEALAALGFAPGVPAAPGVAAGRAGDHRGSAAAVASALAAGRYVRAVNFHATPRGSADRLQAQLHWLAERFVPVAYDDLFGLLTKGEWPHERPGVVVNFFDGHRDNLEVAAPALERAGLVGWFFVVAGWAAAQPEDQSVFARRHRIPLPAAAPAPGEDARPALSPEGVAALAGRGHVVASHTLTHSAPSEASGGSPEALEREVAGSRRELERMTGGGPVRALAWRTGPPLGKDARADRALKDAGYELLFANHAVQRV